MSAASDHRSQSEPKPQPYDPLTGYVPSVALALFLCGRLGALLHHSLAAAFPALMPAGARIDLAAGLFLGIALANPVGLILSNASGLAGLLRFGIGLVAGALVQHAVFTPIADEAMSPYLYLLLAAFAIPVMGLVRVVRRALGRRGILFAGEGPPDSAVRLLDFSDRAWFVFFMIATFAVLSYFSTDVASTLGVLAIVVLALAVSVALGLHEVQETLDPAEARLRAWLELESTLAGSESARGWEHVSVRVASLAGKVFPGAVLFAGVTRLALVGLNVLFPNAQTGLRDPITTIETLGILSASGAGLVFLGLTTALGFGLVILRAFAHFQGWTRADIRDSAAELMDLMHVRRFGRG